MKVYKCRLNEGGNITELEGVQKVLHFAYQEGLPTVWVEYDPNALFIRSIFLKMVVTGGNVPVGYRHFMTAMDGHFIGHLYIRDVKNT